MAIGGGWYSKIRTVIGCEEAASRGAARELAGRWTSGVWRLGAGGQQGSIQRPPVWPLAFFCKLHKGRQLRRLMEPAPHVFAHGWPSLPRAESVSENSPPTSRRAKISARIHKSRLRSRVAGQGLGQRLCSRSPLFTLTYYR